LEEETQGLARRQHQGAVAGGRDKLAAKQGSSCPRAAVAPAAGGKDRLQPRGRRSQTQSSLETCLGEMIRIAEPVAIVKAITKVLATTRVTTKAATTRAAQTREDDANVTTARHSLTRMEGHMGHAEGRIIPGAPGAIQLVGGTLGVVTYSLQKGFQTTPGLTELVHTVDSYSNFLQRMVYHIDTTQDLPQRIHSLYYRFNDSYDHMIMGIVFPLCRF